MTAIATTTITRTAPPVPSTRGVFVANIKGEWTKLRSVRSTTWTLLAVVGISVGFGAIVGVSQMSSWDHDGANKRALFDPTFLSLSGLWLAQLAVGVLGVLVISSEYATGQIHATLAATPQRAIVLAAKAATFSAVAFTTGLVASLSAFFIGQRIFATKALDVSITDAGVLRAVVGGALYLSAVGLLGVGLGVILRRTAGAITALVALLVLAPLVGSFLPASFQQSIAKFFPAEAGMAVFSVVHDSRSLTPWTGYLVLLAYVAAVLIVGAVVLGRRDA